MNFERNRYSVPAAFANQAVSIRAYAERLVIVAEHTRVFYNRTRRHNHLGGLSPEAFEKASS